MFEIYKTEVLAFYRQKKLSGKLSVSMENPNRLKLKQECLRILAIKNTKIDIEIIQVFFDPTRKFEDPTKGIEKFDLDKFRPLVTYLRGDTTIIRNDAAVKLLAWLIDFDYYPDWQKKKNTGNGTDGNGYLPDTFGKGNTIALPEPSAEKLEIPDSGNTDCEVVISKPDKGSGNDHSTILNGGTNHKTPEDDDEKDIQTSIRNFFKRIISIKYTILSIVAMLLLVICMLPKPEFLYSSERAALPTEKCMYWTGSRYQPIACHTISMEGRVIPLDKRKMRDQKKISWSDRLNKSSIGKTWYAKIDDQYEFFTDSGMHPVDTLKRLKPLTAYILSNHVSYYRFLLTILLWSLSILGLFFSLIFIKRFKRITTT
ncbi:hypothetical protein ACSBL2_14225 [Pedobacter sp. AW31-3R]|uniref:hypothetical protein n=1 Tax=Pedobacter sp. AW31-3R TaxID=3445781 RepID=UPI003F9EE258